MGDGLISRVDCEAAAIVRERAGWLRFRKSEMLLLETWFSLKIKEKVYCCCDILWKINNIVWK